MNISTKADTMNTAVYEKSEFKHETCPEAWKLIFDQIYESRNRKDAYSNSFNNYKLFFLTRKSDGNIFAVAEQQGENPFLCTAYKVSIGINNQMLNN